MAEIKWDAKKNLWLKNRSERGACFEDVVEAINDGRLLAVAPHKTRPNQDVMVLLMNDYIYSVPFVKDGESIFLKTLFPDRKLTKKYLKAKKHDQ
jgi:uncharacterized DUF497 family protein